MGSMAGRPSTVRGRELGGELRKFREAAGLSGADLARKIDWSPTKVSRMETGTRSVSEVDVAIYLSNCGVRKRKLEEVLELARSSDDGYWLRPSEQLSEELRSLVIQENYASGIASFEPAMIPGLLQTEDYTRALLHWGKLVAPERVETLVSARMARQSLLTKWAPPQCVFFVHETALRSMVGSPAIMNEQMLRLLFADSRMQSQVRIVPKSAGPSGGLSGSFMLLDFEEHPSVTYVGMHAVGLFLEKPADIAKYRKVVDRLSELALDGGQSRELLAQLASEYDRVEDPPDDGPGRGADLAEEQL